MRRHPHEFDHFLRRVHRRYVALFVIERAGLGVLGGCAAALPIVGILIWRGYAAIPFAIGSLLVGGLVGLIWGIVNRPSTLAAAMEADRQLRWADLLSSAFTVLSKSPSDPWAAAVLEVADARCRAASPSSVVLNRLGARAWGGIGLASALVMALGLVPTYSSSSQAEDRAPTIQNPLAVLEPGNEGQREGGLSFQRRTIPQEEPESDNHSRMGSSQTPNAATGPESTSEPPDRNHSRESSDNTSHGTGASHSNVQQPDHLNTSPTGTNARPSNQPGIATAGAGQATGSDAGEAPGSGQAVGRSANASHGAAPWQSPGWQSDARRAMDAVNSGQVPDAYRDVIRGYFERP